MTEVCVTIRITIKMFKQNAWKEIAETLQIDVITAQGRYNTIRTKLSIKVGNSGFIKHAFIHNMYSLTKLCAVLEGDLCRLHCISIIRDSS